MTASITGVHFSQTSRGIVASCPARSRVSVEEVVAYIDNSAWASSRALWRHSGSPARYVTIHEAIIKNLILWGIIEDCMDITSRAR